MAIKGLGTNLTSPISTNPITEMQGRISGNFYKSPMSSLGATKKEIPEEVPMTEAPNMSTKEGPKRGGIFNKLRTTQQDIQRQNQELQAKIDGINRPTPTADFGQFGANIGGIGGVSTPTISPTLQTPEFQVGYNEEQKVPLSPDAPRLASSVDAFTDADIATIAKEKYPELAGGEYSDSDIATIMREKYPELGIQTEFSEVEGKNPLLRAGAGLLKGGIGAVKGAYEGLVPGFKEMIRDSKRIIADPKKSFPEKFNQILFGEIGADYIGGAIGDTFGGALEGLYKGFTTSSEREYVNDKVKGVMKSLVKIEPVQNIMKKYNQLQPEEQQELNDLLGYGMNVLEFVGIGLAGKPIKEAAVRGLRVGEKILQDTLGETTEQVLKKGGEVVKKVGEISPVEATARALTKTATAQDKLFKAQNPSLNVLNKNRNFKTVRSESDLANQLIVDAGHVPVDTETRRIAHESTMESKWADVESKVQNKKDLMIDQNQFADIIDDVVADVKKSGLVKNKADIEALEAEAKAMRKQGMIDIPTLEKRKQYINGIVNNWGDSAIGDVYKNGMKKVTRAIGEVEDATLAKIPGEFSSLKKEFGALKSTYEDILKADLKNQKAKGLNIIESYSRIEGIGDIIGGTMSIFTRGGEGVKDVVKGVGKLFLGKALKKAADPDFLVKEGFQNLSRKIKPNAPKGLPVNMSVKPVDGMGQNNIEIVNATSKGLKPKK